MSPEQITRLREPFPAEHVGLLPKITCRDCSDARSKVCDKHSKAKCNACGNFITDRHMHIDYVGHGAVTDRLLEVDPAWTWEPLAMDTAGMPTFIYDSKGNPVTLWIKLTVGDVTRIGVGSAPSGQADAEKVLIGDALRNAAMRFGVALDLWIKGHAEDDERTTGGRESGRGRSSAAPLKVADAKKRLLAVADGDREAAAVAWKKAGLTGRTQVSEADVARAEAELHQLAWAWGPPAADRGEDAPGGGEGSGGPVDREAADVSTTVPPGADGADMDTPPEPDNRRQPPRTITPTAVRIMSEEVFAAEATAAPRGHKTKVIPRLRHALIHWTTGGAAKSTVGLDPPGLLAVWQRLVDITEGRVKYDLQVEDGVRWIDGAGVVVTVMWAELEPEPEAAG